MKNFILFGLCLAIFPSCEYVEKLELRAKEVNNYEKAALNLASDNRRLKQKISQLEFRVSELEAKNKFMALKIQKKKKGFRAPASVRPMMTADPKNDLVKFQTYKWKDSDLLKIAKSELKDKNYTKASQYYFTLIKQYPMSELITDEVLFQAGMSSFESGQYYTWTTDFLSKLVKDYPNSKYYRGAKLWRALAFFKKGDTEAFYNTVEEFRLKYRNTPEWKILSKHYEELTNKYKN